MIDFTHLYIYPDCQYRKNLKAGLYPLGTLDIQGFYGNNVALHTIVGRNGSGKSSLLDIMIRMANNVGALMCKKEKRDASDRVRYARHIYADLGFKTTYVIDGDLLSMAEKDKVHECILCVRDICLWLEFDQEIYWLSDTTILNSALQDNLICNHIMKQYKTHFHDYSDMSDLTRKHEIAAMLFYTIATNYSMLGFIAADYADEESLEYDDRIILADNDGKILINNAKERKMITTEGWVDTKNWLTGLFHKNDGYMCPLVLNPYRDNGHINMSNEAALTNSRLTALLIMYKFDERPLIDDYQLDYIEYSFKKDFYTRFRSITKKDDKERTNLLADGGDLNYFMQAAMTENSWSWTVLDELDLPANPELHKIEVAARLYLVYKIFNIAATYPYYARYRKYGNINKVFYTLKKAPTPRFLRKLVQEVVERHTHVEQKVHQVLNFILFINRRKGELPEFNLDWLLEDFTYSDYVNRLSIENEFKDLNDCMRNLPPSIFRQSLLMKMVDKNRIVAGKIPFGKLSSGQKQLLFQLSTLVYHMVNLKSVPQNEIRYHNINIILDEIEVCFHPEYQRNFVSRLLDLLCDTLHLNDTFGIHIWLTTHSPFILSDIPESLITYMKQGHCMTEEEKQADGILPPMAANVSDLLHQSFFLDKGFIGEYTRRKILNAISFMRNDAGGVWTDDSLRDFINGIGEPFIKKNLVKLWEKKYEKNFD